LKIFDINWLLDSVKIMDNLSTKSNPEIADLLRTHVWAEVPWRSPVSELLEEAIDRLEDCK
jgi:hypothetical protein